MFKNFFTPKEANQKLAHIKKIVDEILGKGKRLRALLEENQDEATSLECQALSEDIESSMAQLEEIGCFYKDWNFEIGLVDFPAMIDGEEALLCWRSDEREILWYHAIEDGYAGRRPLPAHWLLGDMFKEEKF